MQCRDKARRVQRAEARMFRCNPPWDRRFMWESARLVFYRVRPQADSLAASDRIFPSSSQSYKLIVLHQSPLRFRLQQYRKQVGLKLGCRNDEPSRLNAYRGGILFHQQQRQRITFDNGCTKTIHVIEPDAHTHRTSRRVDRDVMAKQKLHHCRVLRLDDVRRRQRDGVQKVNFSSIRMDAPGVYRSTSEPAAQE